MPKKFLIALTLGLAALSAIIITMMNRSSEIDRHKAAIARLHFASQPKSLRGYLSLNYLLWTLQGRHTLPEVQERYDAHLEKLVALGYLQSRTFTLAHQESTGNWTPMVIRMFGTYSRGDPFTACSVSQPGTQVTVIARPDQMPLWEERLRQFDLTNRPPETSR